MMCLRLMLLLDLLTVGYSTSPSVLQRLYHNLTSGYDQRLRSTSDMRDRWVNAAALPYFVLELSTSDQRLSILMGFTIMWKDVHLTWNATEYDGIDRLVFRTAELWRPRITLGVSYTGDPGHIGDREEHVTVHSNGTVVMITSSSVSVLCVLDIAYFPFDSQKCDIALSVPPTYSDEIYLYPIEDIDIMAYLHHNPEWHVLDINTTVFQMYGQSGLHYTYLFRRRAEFVAYTTIVPLILLSVLNACVVLVPVSSGEKGSIAVTIFLSYCVYLTSIGETLPPNSEKTSYLLLYMTIVQTFSALTMLYSVVETRMYIYGHKTMYSLFSCKSKIQQIDLRCDPNEDVDNIDRPTQTATDDPCDTDVLTVYRKLDIATFLVCIALNTIIVIVFAILTINSIQDSLK